MDGILVVAKPPGPTSHDVVALVRRLSGTRRVGHGGTLDPFASGVLPLFLGRATRLVEYHIGDRKGYRATVCFGAASTTDDMEGEFTPTGGAPSREAVVEALARFRGEIAQVPPAYSAIKVEGRRAYAVARGGEAPALVARTVTIDDLQLVEWDGHDPERPIAVLEVTCSAGTYIRAIARDLGTAVGSAAYLGALVRTASGPFDIGQAVSLEEIRTAASAAGGVGALLLAADAGLDAFPEITLSEEDAAAILKGQFVRPAGPIAPLPEGARYRLRRPDGSLLALADLRDGRLAPDKVLAGATPEGERERGPREPRPPRPGGATPVRRNAHMRVVPGLAALTPAEGRLFVVVGVFDGLHRGHAYLLERLRDEARRLRARPAVITFDAHPDEILRGSAPPILVDPDERLLRLADAGVAVTVVQHFDAALRMTPFRRFVEMITERTDLAGFLMTPDAAFGHERGGTPATLAALGAEQGFEVVVVPPFELDGRQVRSSEIRERVAVGDLDSAAAMLGRPFAVTGETVLDGLRGSVHVAFRLPPVLPPDGEYAVEVQPLARGAAPGPPIESRVEINAGAVALPAVAGMIPGGRLRIVFPPPSG